MNIFDDFTLKRRMYFEFREMFLKNRFFSNMLCTVNITFAYEEEREREVKVATPSFVWLQLPLHDAITP